MLLALLTSACACNEGMPSDGADALDAAGEVDGCDAGGEEAADVNDGWAEETTPDTDDPSGEDPATDGESGGDGDPSEVDAAPCSEQQLHERYCIQPEIDVCYRLVSFCRDGQWQCRQGWEHPPPMPEFEDWAWRCGVYKCSVPAITTEPPADWQDNPLEPYVPPEPATLTGEWVKLADLASTVPIGCERQPRQEGMARALAVSPSDPRILFVGFAEGVGNVVGVWKSVDGGVTWFEARAGLGSQGCYCFECEDPAQCEYPDPGVYSLYVDPDDPDLVFASTWERGLYRTEDGGRYWTKVELPLPWPEACMATEHFGPMGPVGRGPDGVYHAAACGDYHFASYDLGETWENWGQVSQRLFVSTWTFDLDRPSRIWAGMRQNGYPVESGGWIYQSEDGGRTWTKKGAGIEARCLHEGITRALASCSSDLAFMAAAIFRCGLFLSRDGGMSWQEAAPPYNGRESTWTWISDAAHDRGCEIFASWSWDTYGLHRSTDHGSTWELEVANPFQSFFTNPYLPGLMVGLVGAYSSVRGFEIWAKN